MENFRDANDGCSGLVWNKLMGKWNCSDSLGNVCFLTTKERGIVAEYHQISDEPIPALAISTKSEYLAYAEGDSVTVKKLSDLKNDGMTVDSSFGRRNLPITNIQFSPNEKFL